MAWTWGLPNRHLNPIFSFQCSLRQTPIQLDKPLVLWYRDPVRQPSCQGFFVAAPSRACPERAKGRHSQLMICPFKSGRYENAKGAREAPAKGATEASMMKPGGLTRRKVRMLAANRANGRKSSEPSSLSARRCHAATPSSNGGAPKPSGRHARARATRRLQGPARRRQADIRRDRGERKNGGCDQVQAGIENRTNEPVKCFRMNGCFRPSRYMSDSGHLIRIFGLKMPLRSTHCMTHTHTSLHHGSTIELRPTAGAFAVRLSEKDLRGGRQGRISHAGSSSASRSAPCNRR